jgi:hypothetical protein
VPFGHTEDLKRTRGSSVVLFESFESVLYGKAIMTIKKQEFYEGAAIHLLISDSCEIRFRYDAPFFIVNDSLSLYLKYSARGRSPWAFTFFPEEQMSLIARASHSRLVIGLICGSDGVAALECEDYKLIALPKDSSVHVSCYRAHGEHYKINGPDGSLSRKVAPSAWQRILENS